MSPSNEPPVIETPEPPHPPHAHKGPRWFDVLITLTLVIISMGSLYVSIHTGETMEKLVKQNERLVRASSTPLLQFNHGNAKFDEATKTNRSALTFSVANVGAGPARIVWFEARYKDKSLPTFGALGDIVKPQGALTMTMLSTPIASTLMTAGEERDIFVWNKPPDIDLIGVETWKRVDAARWELEVEVCYCSLFDECWTTYAKADVPKPVARCDATGRTSLSG